MADRVALFFTCILLVAAANDATAMELDTLLPTDIPGYGAPQDFSVLDRAHPEYTPIGIDLDAISLLPKLTAGAGYDSNPNGAAAASPLYSFNPSLTALDKILGFGASIAGNYSTYPNAPGQDLSGYTAAIGEHALLPRETLDIAIATIAAQETGFGLNNVAIADPVGVAVNDVRASDAVICGMLTVTPEVSATQYRFNGFGSQNRTDYRQSLTSEFIPGGPARFVTLVHATESAYSNHGLNANTYSALAGIADTQTGMWNIRLLAGAAARHGVSGKPLTAPVAEASISWMPSELDSITFDLAREIDDPDQESADGYTVSQARISLAHEYLRNVIITGSFKFSHAAYFHSALVESLYNANTSLAWQLNSAFSLNANYAFNDRQANFLKAANQQIFTLGVTWSP